LIRIAISPEAFAAVERTLTLGTVAVEPQTNGKGERLIWLAPHVVNKPLALRGSGESYSDVIVRIAKRGP
jgi:hypothetical protein